MASHNQSLHDAHPQLAAQWHPTKNGHVTPHDVGPSSNKKYWWLCPKDPRHEWPMVVYARKNGNGCPFYPCSPRPRASDWYNLRTEYPNIAAEFHPSKNGAITPEQIVPFSTKQYWWQCPYGHEWEARVDSRAAGSGCNTCHAQTSKLELRLFCELKFLFDGSKVHLRKRIAGQECDIYIPGYNLGIEVDGYPWHRDRRRQDSRKTKVFTQHQLQLIRLRDERLARIKGPVLWFDSQEDYHIVVRRVVQYLYDKKLVNPAHKQRCHAYLASDQFKNSAEYQELVADLRRSLPGTSLAESHPNLVREWDVDENVPLTPDRFSAGSHEKVTWRCAQCTRRWPASIKSRARRTKPSGCPYCAGCLPTETNNLKVNYSAIAAEWDDENNGTLRPEDVLPCSHQKVWWKCRNGHSWEATVANRTAKNGTGCRYYPCTRKGPVTPDHNLKVSHPQVAKEWYQPKNGTRRPKDVSHGMDRKVWWKCKKCKHIWKAAISSRTCSGRGCKKCRTRKGDTRATPNASRARQQSPSLSVGHRLSRRPTKRFPN